MTLHRKEVRKILTDAVQILRDFLDPGSIVRTLKSKQILTDDDAAIIEASPAMGTRVEKLLDVLKRKKVTAYTEFMAALEKDRDDLYEDVKKIEEALLARSTATEEGSGTSGYADDEIDSAPWTTGATGSIDDEIPERINVAGVGNMVISPGDNATINPQVTYIDGDQYNVAGSQSIIKGNVVNIGRQTNIGGTHTVHMRSDGGSTKSTTFTAPEGWTTYTTTYTKPDDNDGDSTKPTTTTTPEK